MPDHFYVYPAYLKNAGPRALGRRVPAAEAVAEASVEEIVRAARALGYKAEAEAGKQYPRQVHRYEGRVKVTKKLGVPKTRFLRELAREMRTHPPETETP